MFRFLTLAVLTLLPLVAWGEEYLCVEDMAEDVPTVVEG